MNGYETRTLARGGLRWTQAGLIAAAIFLAGCRTGARPATTTAPTSAPAAAAAAPTTPAAPAATATLAPPTATATPEPSPTPDFANVPEQYEHPEGLFRIRYPSGWSAEDLSDEDEILLRFGGSDEQGEAAFLVNLIQPGGDISESQLEALIESYLDNFFDGQTEAVALEREALEDGSVRVIARNEAEDPAQQVHLEFLFTPAAPLFQTLLMFAPESEWSEAEPVFANMARSFELDAAQSGLVPVAQAPEDGVEGLNVVNTNQFTATTGSLYVVGEVQNTTEQAFQEVEITARLVDSTGVELARERWPAKRMVVGPGESVPFAAIFENPPAEFAEIGTTVTANPAEFYLDYGYYDFAIQQDTGDVPSFGDYKITGAVMNTGENAAGSVEIIGALYDAEGRVLAVDSTPLAQEVLDSEAAAPFELVFFGKAPGDVARYEVSAQGIRIAEETPEAE